MGTWYSVKKLQIDKKSIINVFFNCKMQNIFVQIIYVYRKREDARGTWSSVKKLQCDKGAFSRLASIKKIYVFVLNCQMYLSQITHIYSKRDAMGTCYAATWSQSYKLTKLLLPSLHQLKLHLI